MAKPRTKAVSSTAPPVKPERSDAIESLFTTIANEPDDWATYLVLADALLERTDPRGELIQVQHALATGPKQTNTTLVDRERRLITEARARLLGPKLSPLPTIAIDFRFGFADSISLADLSTSQLIAVFEAMAASSDARLLRSIEIHPDEDNYTRYQLRDLLAAGPVVPPSVRRLRLGNAFVSDPGDRNTDGGDEDRDEDDDDYGYESAGRDDLSAVLDVFRTIEDLEVDLGSIRLVWRPLTSPVLQRFTWVSPRIRDAELAPLATSRLPALAGFTLWTGAEFGPGEPEDEDSFDEDDEMGFLQTARVSMKALRSIFTMLDRHPTLRELGLPHYCGPVPALLNALANHPCVRRIDTLDLGHRALDDEDADAIVDFLTDTPNIKRLDIDDVRASTPIQNRLARRIKCIGAWGDEPTRFRLVATPE